MAEYFGIRIEEIFNSMEARFLPQGAQGIRAAIGYRVSGEGGGAWKLTVDDGKMKLEKLAGDPQGCDLVITADAATFAGITSGKLNAADAFGAGKISAMGDATIMSKVLPKVFSPFQAAGRPEEKGEELIRRDCVTSIRQRFATGSVMGTWFKGLKEKKFLANKCPRCGRTQVPPREACAECRVRCTEYMEVGPEATVTAIDKVFYASPDPLTGKVRETPYAAFFMVLDGCTRADSFSHEIKREDFKRLKTGSRVKPVWAENRTGSFKDLLYFEIIE
jgi:uncharacterized OB-fold protein/putative sterol carrier protein